MKKDFTFFLFSCFLQLGMAQGIKISGQVNDGEAIALPGVSVVIKNTVKGTINRNDGQFAIEVPNDKTVLLVTYIGYAPQEIPPGSQTTFDIVLKESRTQLGEVVVAGFGTAYRKEMTGSVAKVGAKDFELQPVQTGQKMLCKEEQQGFLLTLEVEKLGQGLNIRVRGISSVSAGNQPLFVIDGVPVISEAIGKFY